MQRYLASVLITLVVSVFAMAMFADRVFAHGVVGKRLFVEPIVTEDANIFSEYDLVIPTFVRGKNQKELEFSSSLTLRLTENLGIEIEGAWADKNRPSGPNIKGFDNMEIVLKYVANVNPAKEWIFTVALSGELPVGNSDVKKDDFYSIGTGIFYGKGFGGLPEWAKYLRPLMLQGDFVVEHHLTNIPDETFNTLKADFAFYYSLPYLQQVVKDLGIPAPFSRLFPMVEISSVRTLNGPNSGLKEVFARPGLMWVGKSTQVGVAAVIPVTEAARDAVDIGVTGIISLYLDDFFPKQFKDPLF